MAATNNQTVNDMKTLVVLDYVTSNVLFITISDEMVKKLEDEYEGDSEAWLQESGLEEKFGFRVRDANWMLVDDYPELFSCNPQNGEITQMFTVF